MPKKLFNKSNQKKLMETQTLGIIILLPIVLFLISWGLIRPRRETLVSTITRAEQARLMITRHEQNLRLRDQLKRDYKAAEQQRYSIEASMAKGDVYRWLIATFNTLQDSNGVEITEFEPPEIVESEVSPKNYKEARFSISGRAFYQDFGQFLASSENWISHMTVRTLELEPAHLADPGTDERDKLSFKLHASVLVLAPPLP